MLSCVAKNRWDYNSYKQKACYFSEVWWCTPSIWGLDSIRPFGEWIGLGVALTYQDEIVVASGDLGCLVVVVDDITAGGGPRQRRQEQQRQDRRGGHLALPKAQEVEPGAGGESWLGLLLRLTRLGGFGSDRMIGSIGLLCSLLRPAAHTLLSTVPSSLLFSLLNK
jgi:hypothetical protein